MSIFLSFFVLSFYSTGISVTCKRWNVIYDFKKLFRRKQQNDQVSWSHKIVWIKILLIIVLHTKTTLLNAIVYKRSKFYSRLTTFACSMLYLKYSSQWTLLRKNILSSTDHLDYQNKIYFKIILKKLSGAWCEISLKMLSICS